MMSKVINTIPTESLSRGIPPQSPQSHPSPYKDKTSLTKYQHFKLHHISPRAVILINFTSLPQSPSSNSLSHIHRDIYPQRNISR